MSDKCSALPFRLILLCASHAASVTHFSAKVWSWAGCFEPALPNIHTPATAAALLFLSASYLLSLFGGQCRQLFARRGAFGLSNHSSHLLSKDTHHSAAAMLRAAVLAGLLASGAANLLSTEAGNQEYKAARQGKRTLVIGAANLEQDYSKFFGSLTGEGREECGGRGKTAATRGGATGRNQPMRESSSSHLPPPTHCSSQA